MQDKRTVESDQCLDVNKKSKQTEQEVPMVVEELGEVKFFDARDCVKLVDKMGGDMTVVNSARVSFGREKSLDEDLNAQDVGLVKYLATHGHISPFFHPVIQLRIKMPIFVARQWFKHTIGFARNEISRRYVNFNVESFVPTKIRPAAKNKKQGSNEVDDHPDNEKIVQLMTEISQKSLDVYKLLIESNVCSEQARIILPQGMMTEFIETASLAAYARLYNLRNDPHAQVEIRAYAVVIGEIMREIYPVSWPFLVKHEADSI